MSANPDELDDGLDYAYDSDPVSGGEEVKVPLAAKDKSDSEEEKVPEKVSRSLQDEQDSEDEKNNDKKRKRGKNEKLVNKKKQKMEFDIEQKQKLAVESPERIADFIAAKIRSLNPDLTPLELSELYVPKNVIKYTGFWEKQRNLDGLQDFLETNFKKYIPEKQTKDKIKNKSKNKNKNKKKDEQPQKGGIEEDRKFILILSMSALRVCDIHRATKNINNSSIKLISKNKLKDDMQLLKTTGSRVLASTPLRIVKILNEGGSTLKLREIKTIIIDSSYLDPKKRTIWDSDDIITHLKDLTKEGAKVHLY